MRLGVFGGAFDPPHLAHVALVQAAMAQLQSFEQEADQKRVALARAEAEAQAAQAAVMAARSGSRCRGPSTKEVKAGLMVGVSEMRE